MAFTTPPPLPDWLGRLLPLRRGAYRLESGEDAGRLLHFLDQGDPAARPVLMLHGNPAWSFLWRRVIERLPAFRCVAPDLLGLGLSSRLPRIADHTVERHAAALAELVERLELRDVVLAGHDWGGLLGSTLGERLPGRIAAVVWTNTVVVWPRHPRGTAFHRFARVPVVSTLAFRGLGFPQRQMHWVQGDRRSIRGEVARAYRWPLRTWADRVAPLALARMVPSGPDHPSMPALRRGEAWARAFPGPVALVWGLRDPVLARALPRHERAFPQAPVTRTAGGHFLQEEVPDALAAAVGEVARRLAG